MWAKTSLPTLWADCTRLGYFTKTLLFYNSKYLAFKSLVDRK